MGRAAEDRDRAERALGRPWRDREVVHHHTATQLVICDRRYHSWLHAEMKRRGVPTPTLPFRRKRPGFKSLQVYDECWRVFKPCAVDEGRPMYQVVESAIEAYILHMEAHV